VVGAERRPEALVTQGLEEGPRNGANVAGVALEHVVLVLSHAIHVERREPDFVPFRCALRPEEVLAPVQPGQRIVLVVECRKGDLLEAGNTEGICMALIWHRRRTEVGKW